MKYISSIPSNFNVSFYWITLKKLMEESSALDQDEIDYWLATAHTMSNPQVDRLYKILLIEKMQLYYLDQTYDKICKVLWTTTCKSLWDDYDKRKWIITDYVNKIHLNRWCTDEAIAALFRTSWCNLFLESDLLSNHNQ